MKAPANGPQAQMGLDFTLKLVPFVDPTEARSVAGFGPDDSAGRRGGNHSRKSSEVCSWDRTDQGPPLWFGDFLGLTTADALIPCSRPCEPCAIAHVGVSGDRP